MTTNSAPISPLTWAISLALSAMATSANAAQANPTLPAQDQLIYDNVVITPNNGGSHSQWKDSTITVDRETNPNNRVGNITVKESIREVVLDGFDLRVHNPLYGSDPYTLNLNIGTSNFKISQDIADSYRTISALEGNINIFGQGGGGILTASLTEKKASHKDVDSADQKLAAISAIHDGYVHIHGIDLEIIDSIGGISAYDTGAVTIDAKNFIRIYANDDYHNTRAGIHAIAGGKINIKAPMLSIQSNGIEGETHHNPPRPRASYLIASDQPYSNAVRKTMLNIDADQTILNAFGQSQSNQSAAIYSYSWSVGSEIQMKGKNLQVYSDWTGIRSSANKAGTDSTINVSYDDVHFELGGSSNLAYGVLVSTSNPGATASANIKANNSLYWGVADKTLEDPESYVMGYVLNQDAQFNLQAKTIVMNGVQETSAKESLRGFEIWNGGHVNIQASDAFSLTGVKAIAFNVNGRLDITSVTGQLSGDVISGDDAYSGLTFRSTAKMINTGLYALNAGQTRVHMGDHSVLIGTADNFAEYQADSDRAQGMFAEQGLSASDVNAAGKVMLSMGANSQWHLTDHARLDDLETSDSVINLTYQDPSQTVPTYKRLTIHQLNGTNNQWSFGMNIAQESKEQILTDQLLITQSNMTGDNQVKVALSGGVSAEGKMHSDNWIIRQDAHDQPNISFSGQGLQNGSTEVWQLRFVSDQQLDQLDQIDWREQGTQSNGQIGGWYLFRDKRAVTPEEENIQNLGSSINQYLAWKAELGDLRTRLGEVRYGAQESLWVQYIHDKEKASGLPGRQFEQKTQGIHLGFDRLAWQSEESSWLIGAALRYAQAKQSGLAVANNGTGDLEQWTLKGYASYMNQSGIYMDTVLQTGLFTQTFEGLNNEGNGLASSKYDTYGIGASVEVGRMIAFADNVDDRLWYDHYFIEPQAQLSAYWLKGKSFSSSTGMAVEQDDATFLTGRLGIDIGKKFNYDGLNQLSKRYVQVALRAGLTYEFLSNNQNVRVNDHHFKTNMGELTYYYGLDMDWQFSHHSKMYFQVEQERGDDYQKALGLRVGCRYSF